MSINNKKVFELKLINQKNNFEVALSGSKSFTNRALILTAIAEGKSILINASKGDDTENMIKALRNFGLEIIKSNDNLLINNQGLKPYRGSIDIGPSGTTIRFLTSFCSGVENSLVELRGSERMHQRPIKDLVQALQSVGVEIKYLDSDGFPPIEIKGRKKQTSYSIKVKGDISSQFLTSIMLSASLLASYVEIFVEGELVSKSYVDMTLFTLKQFGVNVIKEGYNYFLIAKTEPLAGVYNMDGDASGAGYFWSLGLASGCEAKVLNLDIKSPQGDLGLLEIFKSMGAEVVAGNNEAIKWISVKAKEELKPVTCDLTLLPDSAQTLAVLCSMVNGESLITGLGTLKHKETDRLQALQNELKKINIKTEITDNSIKVFGGTIKIPQEGVIIDTYEDHRMAMSFAILAAKYQGIKIKDPNVVTKSFPDFWEKLKDCGVDIK